MAAAIDFLMSYYYAIFLLWLIICPSMKVAMTFWTDFERYFFCSLFNVLKIVTHHHLGTLFNVIEFNSNAVLRPSCTGASGGHVPQLNMPVKDASITVL